MVGRASLLCAAAVLAVACGLDELGEAPASGGSSGAGGASGGSGGTPSGGSAGAVTGGAAGTGGSLGGSAGLDAGADVASDTALDVLEDTPADGPLVTALDGARIELPCTGVVSSVACNASSYAKSFAFEGQAGASYDLTLRFRGVVEQNAYSCSSTSGSFCTGGSPLVAGWNVFSVKVADPAQIYYLNAGNAGFLYCFALDYQATIPVKGGAQIELVGDAIDGQQVQNADALGKALVIPGISPDPQAFNGQFVQIDVVSIQKN